MGNNADSHLEVFLSRFGEMLARMCAVPGEGCVLMDVDSPCFAIQVRLHCRAFDVEGVARRAAMVENQYIDKPFPPFTVDVEVWQLKFFAKAVGETNPIYFDEDAARKEGHRSILAPPTYAVTLSCAVPDPFAHIRQLGMDVSKILHANHRFEYFAPIYARDQITFVATIVDFYEKRRGKFVFMVEETVAHNQFGELTARFKQTTVEYR